MKKYDWILVAVYVLFIVLLAGIAFSFARTILEKREQTAALCEKVKRTDICTVVFDDTHFLIRVTKDPDRDFVEIIRGQMTSEGIKKIRLSNDTLYIGPMTEREGNFLWLTVPDSVKIDSRSATNITFK